MKWIRIGPYQLVNLERVQEIYTRECNPEGVKFPLKIDFYFSDEDSNSMGFKMHDNREETLYEIFEFLRNDDKFLDLWSIDLPDEER